MYPSILIVDDEPSIRQSLSGLLSDEGFEVSAASNGYEALKMVEADSPDLVLLDIWMPGIDGIETLKEIKKDNPFIQVIIITGHGTIETAVKATKLGAFDFIEKPLSIDKVIVAINNALNFRRLEEENKYLRKKTIEKHSINGTSAAVSELKKQIALVAPTDKWVLITGENGTGKELAARTIHQFSDRADHPLIDVNCAAIPDDLMESELFGLEKGALSGNRTKIRGKFEMADKGTLFLDEIGDMSMRTQARILRVLQEQEFQRVGGSRIIKVNVRVIAATNKDLEKEIEKGNFREELYYRLNVIPIHVPTLRERIEDVPVLVDAFLQEFAVHHGGFRKEMSPDALRLLAEYSWPGNVRELKNLIGRLTITADKPVIAASDIPAPYNPGAGAKARSVEEKLFSAGTLSEGRKAFDREFIRRKMFQHQNNAAKTARAIGVETSVVRKNLEA